MNECIVAHFHRSAWNADGLSGLAMRILSASLSVCLSNALFVTKRKKVVPKFLYRMKDYLR